jgi:hypothetical protein
MLKKVKRERFKENECGKAGTVGVAVPVGMMSDG